VCTYISILDLYAIEMVTIQLCENIYMKNINQVWFSIYPQEATILCCGAPFTHRGKKVISG